MSEQEELIRNVNKVLTQQEINQEILNLLIGKHVSFWQLLTAIEYYCEHYIANERDSKVFTKKIKKLHKKLGEYYGRGD